MSAKKCLKCGKKNPHFFTHCVDCGAKLETERRGAFWLNPSIKAGLILGVSVLLFVFVIIPVIQFCLISGQNFSEDIRNKTETEVKPVPEVPASQPADNGKLRVQITSARDGQNTYNSQKFFLVSIYLQNLQSDRNIQVANSDFELIGSDRNRYLPYGIGSKVQIDLRPGQTGGGEVIYVIPESVSGMKLQFTFPGDYGLNVNRKVVIFNLQ